MSVVVVMRVPADISAFREALIERSAELSRSRERAIASGALHHRFAVDADHVMAIDEWERPEQFRQFFDDDAMREFVASLGCDLSQPPEIWVGRSIDSPDSF